MPSLGRPPASIHELPWGASMIQRAAFRSPLGVLAALSLLIVLLGSGANCGRTSTESDEYGGSSIGGGSPVGCGDGECLDGETCSSCAPDCGKCSSCGNGKCDGSDTCGNCPEDCGLCETCGDHTCNGSEDCGSCPQDCGKCSSCG